MDRSEAVTPQSLGIHPRDLSLFQTGSRMAIQRATLTVRDNQIFMKTENVSHPPRTPAPAPAPAPDNAVSLAGGSANDRRVPKLQA